MKQVVALSLVVALPVSAWAVYAPIPMVQQGQALTVNLEGSVTFDDNILSSAAGEIDSLVYRVAPKLMYNQSVSDQSFLSASYELEALYFDERPTEDTMFNHRFSGKFSHKFDETAELVISDNLGIIDNPESLPAAIAAGQTDQSYVNNVFSARLSGSVSETISTSVRLRHLMLDYDAAALSAQLDREEWLLGGDFGYAVSETLKAVIEGRIQDVSYDTNSAVDSQSFFGLVGFDYDVAQKTSLGLRAGVESRDHKISTKDEEGFYGEATVLHRYAEGSYVSAGIRLSTQDTDATSLYLNEDSRLFFVNVQHMVSGAFYLSGSVSYEDADLNKRPDVLLAPNVSDQTLRFGIGATYMPSENLAIIFNFDHDSVSSDLFARELDRTRFGISARYTFGVSN